MKRKCRHEWWYDTMSPLIDKTRRRNRFCNHCHENQFYSPYITITIGRARFEFLWVFRKINFR
jgi:hypothetical protein